MKTAAEKFAILFGLFSAVALIGLVAIKADSKPQPSKADLVASLSCGSNKVIEEVKDTVQQSPAGRVYGLSIVLFKDAEETYRTTQELKCHANTTLNSAETVGLSYRIYFDSDSLMINTRFDG